MNYKKIIKALLFPHAAIMVLLLPFSIIFLVSAMTRVGTESPEAYLAYLISAYTLVVWCCRVPAMIKWIKYVKNDNKFLVRWQDDVRFRIQISLWGTFAWNSAYGLFQLYLGGYYRSFWYYSMAIYYISLAIMRFFLGQHARRYGPGKQMRAELIRYRACGWIFLALNMALGLMVIFMVYWNLTFEHGQAVTIAMATYTFTTFVLAIVNFVKYRKYGSPVYSAAKAISLASACVSMITLTSTMLTTFGGEEPDMLFRQLMLALLGGAVSLLFVSMAIFMIVSSTKKLRRLSECEAKQAHKDA